METRDLGSQPFASILHNPGGRNVIVVIGIDLYQHLQILHNAVSDAVGVRSLFVDQLGFEEITKPLYNEKATLEAIVSLVRDDLMAQLEEQDNLVFFFAGHGYTQTHKAGTRTVQTGYLIPVEGARPEERRFSTYLKLESFLEDVARLPVRHVLVILDSCYSGFALGEAVQALRSPGDYSRDLSFRMSRRVITSAMADQPALDTGPILGHSLFTGTLIEALALGKADLEHKGFVTSSELGLHIQKHVSDWSMAKQTPDFGSFELDDRGELVINLTGELIAGAGETLTSTRSPGEGRIGLRVDPAQFTLRPGTTLRVSVVVSNLGDRHETIQLSMTGLPEDWASLSLSLVQLDPGRHNKLTLTLKPPRLSQVRAGERVFSIRAESLEDPTQVVVFQGKINLASFTQFESKIEPQQLFPGKECALTIENQGNQPETFNIEFVDPTSMLVFHPPKSELKVPQGQKAVTYYRVSPKKKPLIGKIRIYPFSVQISHPKAMPGMHQAELVVNPILSTRLLLILGLVFSLIVVGIVGSQFIPEKSISPFYATQTALYDDPDGDGLINFDESRLKTDPQDSDTDDDGLDDFNDPQPLIPAVVPESPTSTLTPSPTVSPTNSPTPIEDTPTHTPTVATPTATHTPSPTASATAEIPQTPFGGGQAKIGYEYDENAFLVFFDVGQFDFYYYSEPHSLNATLTGFTSEANYSEFRISPDGEKIAYWLRGGPGIGSLYVLESNGKSRLLGQAISGSMAWDASSKNIAYVCRGTHGTSGFALANPAICVVPVTGGTFYYVLNSDDFNETHQITTLAWSPDGRSIAFASDYKEGHLTIYTIGVNALSRIPLSSARPMQVVRSEYDAAFPAFSPDGEWIAYAMRQDGEDYEIFLVNSNGTNPSSGFTGNAVDDCWPSWSPDGKWLAYTTLSCGIDAALDPSGRIILYYIQDGNTLEVAQGGKPVWINAKAK